ncbi:MAG: Gfo/Idh/MocA family oxidoreductase [Bacteroidota bacterium]
MTESYSRRKILKNLGLSIGVSSLPNLSVWAETEEGLPINLPKQSKISGLEKPVTAIVLGAGNRGNIYGGYALQYPDNLDIIGVAEPIELRINKFSEKHSIPKNHQFKTWEDVFKQPKFANAIIITTPDNLHYVPCMKALSMGYDILLEKPISPSEQECRNILTMSKKTNRIVAVCHVLRYAPYFVKLKELIQSGAIGEIVSMQHLEPISYWHMTDSYVRGNWHNSKVTTPIILAKSCHDLDIIRWLMDKPAKNIQAFGSLKWFRKENDPAGSTARCTDGCKIEKECPFSAVQIYYRDRKRLKRFDLPENTEKQGEAILEILKTTNYGRCVYKMENDQPDHYTTNILFEGGATASFSMEAFTSYEGRRTRIMGTMGDIVGDMTSFELTDFRTNKKTNWMHESDAHGGGDWHLVENWIQAVAKQNANLLSSSIDVSIESHVMGFLAEKSRLNNKVEKIIIK